jgi:DNA-binding transcriptional ArsR family regulator
MQGEDKTERDEWRSDGWWAMLAVKLLHPVQVASIEAFSYIGLSLCIADLAEIVDEIDAVHLDYHLGRLRKLGALQLADSREAQKEFMEIRYRLTEERILGGGR